MPVGFKAIQIVIGSAVSFGNHTFRRPVSHAFQRYSRSKVVLKLETRVVSLSQDESRAYQTYLRDRSCVYTTEYGFDDRQGRPHSLKPAFCSLFYFSELLSTVRLWFKICLKVKVTSVSREGRKNYGNQSAIPRCGADIHQGRKCQAELQF